ncbi:MAG: hypothetical protein AAB649_07245 [Patescibacteria group bacterium]
MATQYTNAIETLKDLFPEYEIKDTENIELAYVVYADFATYIVEMIEKNEEPQLVKRVFDFINSEFNDEKSDAEFLNLLQVEFFEHFVQSMKCINLARKTLNGEAKVWFEKTFEYTGLVTSKDSKSEP